MMLNSFVYLLLNFLTYFLHQNIYGKEKIKCALIRAPAVEKGQVVVTENAR
jgi:hypothetical protein